MGWARRHGIESWESRNASIINQTYRFGDVPFASMTDPPLTTIREPFQKMGHEAAEMLFKIIHGKRLSEKHRVLPVELVIRESTAPPLKRRNKDR